MSTYEQIEDDGTRLRIRPASTGTKHAWLSVGAPGRGLIGAFIERTDVPTVATELLKAVGRADLAEMIEAVEADRSARAEREAAEKKLQERRDAVAREITQNNDGLAVSGYASLNWYTQKAVDRIIELATILEGGASRD